MSKVAMHSRELGRAGSSMSMIDMCAILPIAACAYNLIVLPLLMYASMPPADAPASVRHAALLAPRIENKIFWPALAAIALILLARNWSRLTWPRHINFLIAYLVLAGASTLWAFKPQFSFSRFVLEVTAVASIALPAMMAGRTTDMMRGVFLCYAVATSLNVYFVLNQDPIIYNNNEVIGYPGYFTFKGILGECAAIAFLLALHEMFYSTFRRVLGVVVIAVAIWLMIQSQSKGSLAMSVIAPSLAALTLFVGKTLRISPAMVLAPIPVCYGLLSMVVGNLTNRLSYMAYGNYTLTGRTVIWDFVNYEIARRPFLGWGYQSFWLVGPDAPSVVEAPGWVKQMPSAHNGYLDTMVDTGYIGLVILVSFIFATLHAIGPLANRDPVRAWQVLSLALFVILTNFLESTWLHGTDMLWLIFVIVVGEIGRHCQPLGPSDSWHRSRFRTAKGPRTDMTRLRSRDAGV